MIENDGQVTLLEEGVKMFYAWFHRNEVVLAKVWILEPKRVASNLIIVTKEK